VTPADAEGVKATGSARAEQAKRRKRLNERKSHKQNQLKKRKED
jgi:hypothetical protein